MKTCKYLQESLNFSDALQQIKQEKSIHSPPASVGKQFYRQNDTSKFSAQNFMDGAKYTKRTNLNLKQLLEQYIENSENDYVLTLGIGCIQDKKHQAFDIWISQLSQLQQGQQDILGSNSQNENKTDSQIIKQKPIFTSINDHKRKKYQYQLKSTNANSTTKVTKKTNQTNSNTKEGQTIKQSQSQKQTKIMFRPFTEIKEDEVVQQLEEVIIHNQECISKQRLIQKVSQEINQAEKQNGGPSYNRQEKEIKGLEFSKIKRYKSTKRKRKVQI